MARKDTTAAVITPSMIIIGALERSSILAEAKKLSPPRASEPAVIQAERATANIPQQNALVRKEAVPLLSIGLKI